MQRIAAFAERAAAGPRCSVSWLAACTVLGIRSGAGGALGGRGLHEGAGEGSLHSKLAVLRALLVSLDVRYSWCIAVHCADGANRLWETITDADVKVRI